MTATRILRFGAGFSLVPVGFEHKTMAENWNAWDPDHAGHVDPRFWLEQADNLDSYLASDAIGPVLFFKVIMIPKKEPPSKVAEIHMQFMPQNTQGDHERIRAMLLAGSPWLEELLLGAGVTEINFDSTSPALVAFSTKRLGFLTQGDGTLRKRLAAK